MTYRQLRQTNGSGFVVWSTPAAGWMTAAKGPYRLVMQGDGTLAVFGAPGSGAAVGKSLVVWNSRTGPSDGTVFAAVLNT